MFYSRISASSVRNTVNSTLEKQKQVLQNKRLIEMSQITATDIAQQLQLCQEISEKFRKKAHCTVNFKTFLKMFG